MLPDRVSNPGPPTCESGALPIALRGPAKQTDKRTIMKNQNRSATLGRPAMKLLGASIVYLGLQLV